MKSWSGVLKIIEIEHIRDSKVIWNQKDIYNQIHSKGEELLLNCCFNNDGSYPPAEYYFGLDNRPTIARGDLLSNLLDEPIGGGYIRQSRSSSSGFTVELVNGTYRASSAIITFSASGGSWGPVKNIFLTTTSGSSGVLVSSSALSQQVSLTNGDSVNLRMALSLS